MLKIVQTRKIAHKLTRPGAQLCLIMLTESELVVALWVDVSMYDVAKVP
jgi:hypothetical protein